MKIPLNITKSKEYFDSLLVLFKSIYFNKSCVYLSSPITTGLRYYEWIKQDSNNKFGTSEHYSNVIIPNMLTAKEYIQKIKNKNIICPTIFEEHIRHINLEWTQDDFYYFWTLVLSNVSNVYFTPNWEYSTGCCFEFYLAHINNIKTFEFVNGSIDNLIIEDALLKIKSNSLYENNIMMKQIVNYFETL